MTTAIKTLEAYLLSTPVPGRASRIINGGCSPRSGVIAYFRSEKQFRRLNNTADRSSRMVPLFTLDPVDADEPLPDDALARWRRGQFVGKYSGERENWTSWLISLFYIALLLPEAGVLIVLAI